ncbi:helix-turn-helix domain-containing protein [Rhodococcus hoagii]|nr:helix-turn-helix domain-containing protein [Prescottella equi]NKZ84591.1 helix-turn-helix domain-containing protein [Prescottella equi]
MNTRQEHVGDLIRAAREARGMSRRKASAKSGVSEARLRQIENGVQYRDGVASPVNPKPDKLVMIATAVGLDPHVVLEAAGYDPGIADHIETELPPVEQAVGRITTGSKGARFLRIDDLDDREVELIETFLAGLELGRKSG